MHWCPICNNTVDDDTEDTIISPCAEHGEDGRSYSVNLKDVPIYKPREGK